MDVVVVVSHQPWILVGMQLRYRYRLVPTVEQRQALARAFGCARVVYNDALRLREDTHMAGRPFISDGEVLRLVTTLAKRTPERAWLAEVSAVVLQQSVADLHRAYRNYFGALAEAKAERAKGNLKAKLRVRKPRFKSKRGEQAVRFTANSRFRILVNGRLSLPKVGEVAVRWSRPLPAPPSSVTVTLDRSGRYHLGLHVLATLSDGTTVANPRCSVRPSGPSAAPSVPSAADGWGRPTGTRPDARSPGSMPASWTHAGTSTTSSPPG